MTQPPSSTTPDAKQQKIQLRIMLKCLESLQHAQRLVTTE